MSNLTVRIKSKLNKLFVKNGPYKFLVSRWDEISDISTAANIFNTEFFRSEIKPLPFDFSNTKQVLILAPHQDDESIGAGGLMLKCKSLNIPCNVLFLTDGAQNNLPGKSIEEAIRIRREEALKACAYSNSEAIELGISNLDFNISQESINQFIEIINHKKPTEIAIPWFFDGPIKHRFFNEFLAKIYPLLTHKNFIILGYQVHNQIYPNIFLDISEEMDLKEKMIKEYASQNSAYISYDHITKGINAWNSRYMYKPSDEKGSYCELFFSLPAKDYVKLVNKFYKNTKQIYLNNEVLKKASSELNRLLKNL